jgi:hypothetical protein
MLSMLKRSPFVDYCARFFNEYGIRLIIEEEAQAFINEYAETNSIQVSDALKELLKGASSLNYMRIEGDYTISRKTLEDPKYFDKLFTEWHRESHKEKEAEKNEVETKSEDNTLEEDS